MKKVHLKKIIILYHPTYTATFQTFSNLFVRKKNKKQKTGHTDFPVVFKNSLPTRSKTHFKTVGLMSTDQSFIHQNYAANDCQQVKSMV